MNTWKRDIVKANNFERFFLQKTIIRSVNTTDTESRGTHYWVSSNVYNESHRYIIY